MGRIRVLVIDDSAFMRKMIADLLSSSDQINVVGTARNGADGLKKIAELTPNVVTLDVEMPVLDGIATLHHIMGTNPLPVIMLSSATDEGSSKTIQAISSGAVDFVRKPSGAISLDIEKIKQELIGKVITAAHVRLPKMQVTNTNNNISVVQSDSRIYPQTLIAIGSSTGGPKALQRILTDLPAAFTTPIVIVQHMPVGFTKSLADRLNTLTNIHIKEASHGEIIQKATVYIAPGNFHLEIRKMGTSFAIELSKGASRNGHRPSVDVLLESLTKVSHVNKIAVILTGMGNDGAKGLTYLKDKDPNLLVIAEKEESAVVYGMPKAAMKTNTVNYSVHLHQVGELLTKLTTNTGEM